MGHSLSSPSPIAHRLSSLSLEVMNVPAAVQIDQINRIDESKIKDPYPSPLAG